MATSTGKTHCARCDKAKCTFKCGGCLEDFCSKHLVEHQQEINKQLDKIEVNRDLFRQSLTEQTKEPKNHPSMQQVDKWERDSIKKIQKTAEEARQSLVKHITGHIDQLEIKLNKLTNQLREIRQEDDFNEINLRQFEEELTRLTKELTKTSNVPVLQDYSSLINDIHVDMPRHEAPATRSSTVDRPTYFRNVGVNTDFNPKIQSIVSMESTPKMAALMRKLGTTHQQIDEYSRRRTERISEEGTADVSRIVVDSQVQQGNLLAYANVRSAAVEEEYLHRLQQYVEELDAAKAQNLSVLEKDLNLRQEMILDGARKRIDALNEEANRLKLGVLRDAQAQANAKVQAITDQVAALGAEDCNRLLSSTSTTGIRTDARAAGETRVGDLTKRMKK